ncbi:hypothetical protein COLO4_19763 [Corchorus olitorius]|uniref:Uncharacterized protein n=1 Tax=Corchorus olitorius TaxID=93759 RepID=A0A1R3J3U1_9ROSI|nr:hypothetical protein COLO4_19763 [Corchorus olitorius]
MASAVTLKLLVYVVLVVLYLFVVASRVQGDGENKEDEGAGLAKLLGQLKAASAKKEGWTELGS